MSIVLIGYRGSGKTTVGRLLADRLWQSFVDLDEQIIKSAGRTIAEIFAAEGEAAFRQLESTALEEALRHADYVVATGGGVVLTEENRAVLKAPEHRVIYLRCDAAVLQQRIAADPATAATRPALTPLAGSLEEIQKLLMVREPLYRAVMTAELDVTHLTHAESVVHISRML